MSDGWVYRPPTEPWLDILYEDDDLVVINKPGGLLSVPGRVPARQDSAFVRLQARVPALRVVHRLDMDTSGLLLFACHRAAERELDRQFRAREIGKSYRARVWGHLAADAGIIDLPLARSRHEIRSVVDYGRGKPARTVYRTLVRHPGRWSELDLVPQTGRSHQLRVHLLRLGHPILGDRFYAPPAACAAAPQLMLHAESLRFARPSTGEPVSIQAPLPPAWLG